MNDILTASTAEVGKWHIDYWCGYGKFSFGLDCAVL